MTHTHHAQTRMRQRGIRADFLDSLLMSADLESDIGGGATLYRVSRATAEALQSGDRLARYGAIISGDGALVTVMPVRASSSGARYRRIRDRRASDLRRQARRRIGGFR